MAKEQLEIWWLDECFLHLKEPPALLLPASKAAEP